MEKNNKAKNVFCVKKKQKQKDPENVDAPITKYKASAGTNQIKTYKYVFLKISIDAPKAF